MIYVAHFMRRVLFTIPRVGRCFLNDACLIEKLVRAPANFLRSSRNFVDCDKAKPFIKRVVCL